ncbi:LysR family transcriptional regulator [Neobacillus kokaensis]|uniref:LysR family transcriptional regulator n=1 Tax=Neobacillus kokaensis TaxID=2759023 RepID=A0ABQ3N0C9_9BACI|nr:LysR family transcriptional regulator [Neobacillus kokaensis]GHH97561.1 LysR family transcriptional regulator [Neobacillus kokaensis]
MNVENLRMFCLVVEEGSISKAARLGYVSQPAVSKQIHQLENHYGTLLFERVDGRLSLTEAGEVLYPFAKEIIDRFENSFDAVQEISGKKEAVLRLGASLTIGEYLLPSLLGCFKKSFPDIKFSLLIGNTPNILTKLESNEIDIALVESQVEKNEFLVENFSKDELILVASSNHRWRNRSQIEISELSNEKMIWRESNSGTRLIVEHAFREYGILDRIGNAIELGSLQSIKSAVEAELGVSILPKLTVEKELNFGTLIEVKIENFTLTRDYWMVQKPHRFKKSIVNDFIQFIRKE